jgi:hypothetical protein
MRRSVVETLTLSKYVHLRFEAETTNRLYDRACFGLLN